jgi:hypothetical protein
MKKIGILLNEPVPKTLTKVFRGMLTGILDGVGSSNAVIIDTNNGKKIKNLLNRDDAEIMHITWQDGYDWSDYESMVKEKLSQFELLIVVACAYRDNVYDCDSHKLVDLFEGHLQNGDYTCYTKFVSTRKMLERYMIYKQFKDRKIIHYCLDPRECISTDVINHGFCVFFANKGDWEHAPTFEMSLFEDVKQQEKTTDFVFYGTAITQYRSYLLDYEDTLKNIRNSDVRIVRVVQRDGVTQDQYYDKLSRSKFTLVIPSYDVTTFSVSRFIEAIARQCLPLILDRVDLTDIKNTFPDLYDIMTKYLVVSIDGIQEKIDSIDREALLNTIMNCQTVKNWQDIEYYKQRWSYLINK